MDYDDDMADKKSKLVLKHLTAATTMTNLLEAFRYLFQDFYFCL